MSIDGLGVPLNELTPVAVVMLGVVLIYFGYLIPRWQHKQWIAEKDARLEERQARIDEQADTILAQRDQINLLLNGAVNEAMSIVRDSANRMATQEE